MKQLLTLILLIVMNTLNGQVVSSYIDAKPLSLLPFENTIKVGEIQAGRVTSLFKKGSVSISAAAGIVVTQDEKDESMFTIEATSEGRTGVTITLINKAGQKVTKTIPIVVVAGPIEETDIKVKLPYHG